MGNSLPCQPPYSWRTTGSSKSFITISSEYCRSSRDSTRKNDGSHRPYDNSTTYNDITELGSYFWISCRHCSPCLTPGSKFDLKRHGDDRRRNTNHRFLEGYWGVWHHYIVDGHQYNLEFWQPTKFMLYLHHLHTHHYYISMLCCWLHVYYYIYISSTQNVRGCPQVQV